MEIINGLFWFFSFGTESDIVLDRVFKIVILFYLLGRMVLNGYLNWRNNK